MENDDEDKYVNVSDDDPHANLILEVIKNDSLRRMERIKKHESENCILTAAKLISPVSYVPVKGKNLISSPIVQFLL